MWGRSFSDERGDEWLCAGLPTPVAVQRRVEGRAGRQRVVGIEVLAGAEGARAAVLQVDLHLPAEDENPLRRDRHMKVAAKADGAVAQLQTTAGHQRGEHR